MAAFQIGLHCEDVTVPSANALDMSEYMNPLSKWVKHAIYIGNEKCINMTSGINTVTALVPKFHQKLDI